MRHLKQNLSPSGPKQHRGGEKMETRSDVSITSDVGHFPSVSPPLVADDFVGSRSQWKGGCILSVHDSGPADDWLNQHYEHDLLVDLRANGFGGPVASMLSVDTQALTIFGSMSSKMIEIADMLAQLSGFPVIIRPVTEDPSTYFK